jgi:PAS domain S-box-containing protein
MVAILVLQVRTETFLKWIQSIETGARGYLFIVDRRGSTVAHSRWTANTESVDYSNVVAVKDVLQGKNGVAVGVSVGSEADQVVAYGPISGFGWGVVFQESRASAFALRDNSLTRLRNAYFLLAVGVCVAGYLLLRVLRARRRGDKKFHDLVESAPDGLVMADESGKIVLVNAQAEKIFGYTRHELIGHTVELLMPERFRMHHPKHRQEFLYSGKPRSMGLILQGLRKDGSEFPIDVSLSPVEAEGRRLVISAIRDITERVRLQDQQQAKNEELAANNHMVERANRLKSEFLANMSHELRTPLNGIIGFAELMHDGKVGPIADNHKEYLADILTSAKHLLGLINDVLDLSKVEAGKMEFRPEPIRLTKIASEVVEILRAAASSKRIQVETDIAAAVDDVVIDPAKLKQVLYNYLSNALKFTGDNGEIWLRAKADGPNNFRLEVEDNGIGIAAEHLNKLFIEFQQLDSSVRKKHQGTGLGLALGAAGVKGIQSGVDPYGCAAAGH